MAITIISQPAINSILSAYRPIEFKVTTDDLPFPTTRMLAEVYKNSITPVNKLATLDIDEDFNISNQFTFDIQSIAKNQLGFDLQNLNVGNGIIAAQSSVKLIIRFIELQQQTNGSLLENTTQQINSNAFNCINATLQHNEIQSLDIFKIDNNAGIKRFLTNAPDNKKISDTDNEWLSIIFKPNIIIELGARFIVNIRTFDVNGNFIQFNEYDITALKNTIRFDIGIGAANLNNSTLISGGQPVISSDVHSYTIRVMHDLNNLVLSETRKYFVDRNFYCNKKRFYFLNKLGGFDAYTFTGSQELEFDIKREIYQKRIKSVFETKDRGVDIINIEPEEKFTVHSKLLIKNEAIWLMELLHSQQVFVEESGQYIPIIITSKSIDIFNTFNEIRKIKIEYVFSNKKIIQKA